MKNGRILSELKEIAYSLVDNNGNFRVEAIGLVKDRGLMSSSIDVLKSLITLIRDTKIVSDETKFYIFNRHISIRGVNDELNNLEKNKGKTIPLVTTTSKINYDRSKLERIFGQSLTMDILYTRDNEDKVNNYECLIVSAMMKYGRNDEDLRDNIALQLDKSVLCREISDEQFDSFKLTILPYLKSHMETIAKTIDTDSVGYFNYLLYSTKLNTVDEQRLEELKQLLVPSDLTSEQLDIE